MAADDPHETLATDPDLGPLVDEHGPLRIEPADDPFERLVVSIVRQQLSMDSAAAIRERLFDRVTVDPGTLATADPDRLMETGLSRSKAGYLREAATTFDERGWDRATFADLDDAGVRSKLTEIRGIGPWTADMFLIFALGREDVFPVGDLGIRKAMWTVVDPDLERDEMRESATRWQPYRSYAARYLWRAADG